MLEQKERFVIDDDGKAEWAIRKLAQARLEILEAEKKRNLFIEQYTQETDEWFEKETAEARQTVQYMEHLLSEYLRKQREETGKKSINLPSGKIKSQVKKTYDYNEERLLPFLESRGYHELIKQDPAPPPSVNKVELKKRFRPAGDILVDENGEPVEGVKYAEEIVYKVVPNQE